MCYSARAVQASVNEVYYHYQHAGPLPHMNDDDARIYSASKWAPIPQPASIANHDPDFDRNPAALWLAIESPSSFTYRRDLNDRSNTLRTAGHPGYKNVLQVSDEGSAIKSAAFQQDHILYPGSRPVVNTNTGGMLSGGFLQLSFDPHEAYSDRKLTIFARVWGPVEVKPVTNLALPSTMLNDKTTVFTFRDMSLLPYTMEDIHTSSTIHLHCVTLGKDMETRLVRIDYIKDGSGTGKVDTKIYHMTDAMSGPDNQTNHRDDLTLDAGPLETMRMPPQEDGTTNASTALFDKVPLQDLKHMRVFLCYILDEQFSERPSLIAIAPSRGASPPSWRMALTRVGHEYSSPLWKVFEQVLPGPPAFPPTPETTTWIKKYEQKIFIVQLDGAGIGKAYTYKLRNDLSAFDGRPEGADIGKQIDVPGKPCVLSVPSVDVTGAASLLITQDKSNATGQVLTLTAYYYQEDAHEWREAWTCPFVSKEPHPIHQLHFQGIMPAPNGFRLVQIFGRYEFDGKKYLVLRLFRNNAATSAFARPDSMVESTFEDPWQNDTNYRSIRFLRSTFEHSPGSITQVFSYYGVLGFRIFNLDEGTGKYTLGGQTPYMGQSSEGLGIGSYGRWGSGILPWGQTPQWIDEEYFVPKNDGVKLTGDPNVGQLVEGYWGMNVQDDKREFQAGGAANSRPLWAV